jgi:hypothetical protein
MSGTFVVKAAYSSASLRPLRDLGDRLKHRRGPRAEWIEGFSLRLCRSIHSLNIRSETVTSPCRQTYLELGEERQQPLPLIPVARKLPNRVPALVVDFLQTTRFITARLLFTIVPLLLLPFALGLLKSLPRRDDCANDLRWQTG